MTTQRYHEILDYLRRLVSHTEWEGKLYAVGGCCRDEVMGTEIKDVDIAVNLPLGSIRFARWLEERKLLVGAPTIFPRYATVMLMLKAFPDDELELVQTRKGKYVPETYEHPESLFGSIDEDCRLRDLTINSLYHDISADKLLDPTGCGIDDIRQHRLRTPSDPEVTMTDDPLRALRLIRFASRYGWTIDRPTMEAMKNHISGLKDIKPERIQAELSKILTSPRVEQALKQLRQIGAISLIFPELTKTFRMKDPYDPERKRSLWDRTVRTVGATPPQLEARLAALFHDIGMTCVVETAGKEGSPIFPSHEQHSAQIAKKILKRLKFHSPTPADVSFLCANHHITESWGDEVDKIRPKVISRLLKACASEKRLELLLSLIHADDATRHESRPDRVEAIRNAIAASGENIPDPQKGADKETRSADRRQERTRRNHRNNRHNHRPRKNRGSSLKK